MWIKNIAVNLYRSVMDPAFYKERQKKNYVGGFAHLYWALFATSLMGSVIFAFFAIAAMPGIGRAVDTFRQTAPDLYPPDLVIEIKKGEVTTNSPAPVAIAMPPEWLELFDDTDAPTNLFTVDTNATAEDFLEYDTLLLLTKRSLVAPDKDAGLRVFPLKDIDELTIDKEYVDGIVAMLLPFLDFIVPLIWIAVICGILVMPFIVAGLGWVGMLLYLLLTTLLLWIVAMFLSRSRPYWELYHLSLFTLTLPLLYGLIAPYIGLHYTGVFTVIFVVWTSWILRKTVPLRKA